MVRLLSFAVAAFMLATVSTAADTGQLEKKLLGSWEGGPCTGLLTFKADGTYERQHFTPGNNRLSGTWKLNWSALPPTLTLNCTQSDDADFVGKPDTPKLIELTDGHLTLIYLSKKTAWPEGQISYVLHEGISRYERVK